MVKGMCAVLEKMQFIRNINDNIKLIIMGQGCFYDPAFILS